MEYTHVEEESPDTVRVELIPPGAGGPIIVKGFRPGELTAHLKLNTYTNQGSYDLVVIGSGPAGMSAALKAKTLLGWSTLIVEDNAPGGSAGTALNPINNYLGIPAGTRALDLAHTWMGQINTAGVEWLPGYRATGIMRTEDPRKTGTEDSSLYPVHRIDARKTHGEESVTHAFGPMLLTVQSYEMRPLPASLALVEAVMRLTEVRERRAVVLDSRLVETGVPDDQRHRFLAVELRDGPRIAPQQSRRKHAIILRPERLRVSLQTG